MTATFANFQAQQDAQNTIQLNVIKHCYTLIDALKQNYTNYYQSQQNQREAHGLSTFQVT